MDNFSINTNGSNNVYTITMEGEVDLNTSPQFREAVVKGIEEGYTRVVVDLSEVTFIDSTTLGILVGITKRLQPLGGDLEIIITNDNIRKIFELTSLDKILNIK